MNKRKKSPPPRLDSPLKMRQEQEILTMRQKLGLEDRDASPDFQDSQLPSDKDELIALLLTRLQKTENALDQADLVIEEERKERKELEKEVNARNAEIQGLIESERTQLSRVKEVDKEINKTVSQAVAANQRARNEKTTLTLQIEQMRNDIEKLERQLAMQEQATALVKEQFLPTQNILRIRETENQEKELYLKDLATDQKSLQKQAYYISQQAEQVEEAIKKLSEAGKVLQKIQRPHSLQDIFKIAEGGSPETPVPAAVNMAGNNNDYFYDQGRHQEEYDDDDFWGAPEPEDLNQATSFVKTSLSKQQGQGVAPRVGQAAGNKYIPQGGHRGAPPLGQRGAGKPTLLGQRAPKRGGYQGK